MIPCSCNSFSRVFQLELLYLSASGHREGIDEEDVFRDLMPGDLSAAEIFHLFLRSRHTIVKDDKGTHFLSIFLGRNSGYLHVFHAGEMIEELLQLTWIDILASTDNHILDTAGDTEVSILITNAQVAGMQEAILVDRFIGSGFVL